tara:strand:- start:104 stop:472 length:369 start_codon:yes stop_codon:yes gene_type:complete
MAHFAKVGAGNKVIKVHIVNNEILMKDGVENAQQGIEFLQNLYNNRDLYVQTSYNSTFRKRFAAAGYTYDQTRDAFIEPKPFTSWTFNEETCGWEAPVPYPDDDDDKKYKWDEENLVWKEIE